MSIAGDPAPVRQRYQAALSLYDGAVVRVLVELTTEQLSGLDVLAAALQEHQRAALCPTATLTVGRFW